MTEKLLFTGKTHNTSGRDGGARSSDGHLDIKMTQPHPAAENLFGAAWSACYMGALEVVASQRSIKLPAGTAVDAEIDLNSDAGSTSCGRASMSAFQASTLRLRASCSVRHTAFVRTPRRLTATSTWRPISSERDRLGLSA